MICTLMGEVMRMYHDFGKRVLRFALRLIVTIAVMVLMATKSC